MKFRYEPSAVVTPITSARKGRARASRAASVRPAEVADFGDRVTIDYRPEDLHVHEREAVEALATPPGIFARGTSLVRLAGEDDDPRTGPLERSASTDEDVAMLAREPRVVELSRSTLRVELSRRTLFRECTGVGDDGSPKWRPARIPDDIVKAVHERGAWPGVPELVGVTETPFLRPDGSLCATPGLDPRTGTYLASTALEISVPERPTRADATRALEALEDIFQDFPHVNRADRLVPVAAILTLLARPAIVGNAPAFLFDASTRGSGKSLQTDAVSIVARGRPSAKLSWPSDEDELSKVLSASAIRGAPIVNFDNVASGFGGASLDKCLTASDAVEFRVLGASKMLVLPWRTVIAASGNNLLLLGDTTRRVLVSRLESPLESPEDRTGFRYPHLLAHVATHRARLVSSALTILRAYVAAGRPDMGLRPWGSFESFAALVPQAIAWAGGADADVMRCRPEVAGTVEPEKAALLAVLDAWPALLGPGGGTAKRAIAALYPPERLRGGSFPPDRFDDLRDALEAVTNARPGVAPSAHSVGRFLQRVCARVADGRRLSRKGDRKGITVWAVEGTGREPVDPHAYEFSEESEEP